MANIHDRKDNPFPTDEKLLKEPIRRTSFKYKNFEPMLDFLKSLNFFIIQPKVDTDFLNPTLTHEIFNDKKFLLLKGTSKLNFYLSRKLSSDGPHRYSQNKISICNLKNKKIASVQLENPVQGCDNHKRLCGVDQTSSTTEEAILCCPPDIPLARVSRYGGTYEQPLFEIKDYNSEKFVLFSVEPSRIPVPGSLLDYTIYNSNRHKIGHISSKSGLNFYLQTKDCVAPTDKALLVGFVIAMGILKSLKPKKRNMNNYE